MVLQHRYLCKQQLATDEDLRITITHSIRCSSYQTKFMVYLNVWYYTYCLVQEQNQLKFPDHLLARCVPVLLCVWLQLSPSLPPGTAIYQHRVPYPWPAIHDSNDSPDKPPAPRARPGLISKSRCSILTHGPGCIALFGHGMILSGFSFYINFQGKPKGGFPYKT